LGRENLFARDADCQTDDFSQDNLSRLGNWFSCLGEQLGFLSVSCVDLIARAYQKKLLQKFAGAGWRVFSRV
jgi:hypothetical protein